MKTPIYDFLNDYNKGDFLRLHTPGHKGRLQLSDITEIIGSDNLYESSSIILESEKICSALFGSVDTLYSCSGSTLAIQTMLTAVFNGNSKRKLIASRYSHRSLISSAVLLGIEILWVYPDEYLSADISPEKIESLITSEVGGVFINSIDYYGGESDIAEISKIANRYNIPLLVDNAHGSYKVFTDSHPIRNGATLVADSTHKTLPALTGAAYLHSNGCYSRELLKASMALHGTTSPSYLILESLDLCNKYISENKIDIFHKINDLKNKLSEIYVLKRSDLLRITLDTAEYGYSGFDFADILRENRVECEMSDERYVILLFSVITTETELNKLYETLLQIKKKPSLVIITPPMLKPQKMLNPREAYFGENAKTVPIKEAVGTICASIDAVCPPGVPLIMPGERFDKAAVNELVRLGVKAVRVI